MNGFLTTPESHISSVPEPATWIPAAGALTLFGWWKCRHYRFG